MNADTTGRRRGRAKEGRGRPLWQSAILHAVLLALSIVFLVPLFWLIGSSLKTDDQIKAFPPEWLPNIPYYSARSPYHDPHEYKRVARPETCPAAVWAWVRTALAAEARRTASQAKGPADEPLPGPEREGLERGILTEALASVPPKVYAEGAQAVVAAARAGMTAALTKAEERSWRRLAIGGLTFRTSGQEPGGSSKVLDAVEWSRGWEELMPQLVDGKRAAVIRYWQVPHERRLFGRADAMLDLPPGYWDFHSLTLQLHGDRSWRQLSVTVGVPCDGVYRTERPILLSGSGWTDMLLIREPRGAIPWGAHRLTKAGPIETGVPFISVEVLAASHAQVILRKLLNNYPAGLTFIPFTRYLLNTLLICALVVLGTILSCSLVAYGLTRIQWRGRNALFYVIIGTMMLPFQVTMVPMFVVYAKLGWVDTFLPLTVPAFFGNAFFIFLLRQFFLTVPPELTDAARIDGCSELDIFRRVILPLAKPALATVGLFAFMGTWNDYIGPLIYLSDASRYTLSLGLASFSSQYGSYPGMLMAVTTVMTVPIVILFFLAQRTFIQGITLTGIKG